MIKIEGVFPKKLWQNRIKFIAYFKLLIFKILILRCTVKSERNIVISEIINNMNLIFIIRKMNYNNMNILISRCY